MVLVQVEGKEKQHEIQCGDCDKLCSSTADFKKHYEAKHERGMKKPDATCVTNHLYLKETCQFIPKLCMKCKKGPNVKLVTKSFLKVE